MSLLSCGVPSRLDLVYPLATCQSPLPCQGDVERSETAALLGTCAQGESRVGVGDAVGQWPFERSVDAPPRRSPIADARRNLFFTYCAEQGRQILGRNRVLSVIVAASERYGSSNV